MKTLLYIGFWLISLNSFAQVDKLALEFRPSFIKNSKLIIDKKEDGYTMNIKTDNFDDSSFLSDLVLVELNRFFGDYRFKNKSSIDTISQEKVVKDGDTLIYNQLSFGTDGIDVYGELIQNDKNKTFKFWSPKVGDKNHELIKIIFGLMYNHFENQKTINYLEQLEQYFDFGLGLRKLNTNPLTYKLYGSISSDEADELYAFFESLPIDKKVYLDMSNFNGMGTMFDEDFLELSESHKLITWVNCSEGAKMTLQRAEIKKRRYK